MAPAPFSLEGKTVIVTGGGIGIGKSISLECARAGADIMLCSRRMEHLEATAEEIRALGKRALPLTVDVRDPDQVHQVVQQTLATFGKIDVLVNNHGASFRAPVESISLNGWNAVVTINLNGVFLFCQTVGKHMIERHQGVIVNIASIAGVRGSQMMSHYAASKAAVINFTTTLALEWAPHNIRVNCIAPGPIETEGYLDVLHRTNPNAEAVYQNVASRVALGRWGRVEEIAYPTIFLASDASSFMTGTTINVDGGPTRRETE
ncbi:MAG: SDR family NAD(P)-dependent oxidoreductase [Candidatus Tectimicrobiota bacterium]